MAFVMLIDDETTITDLLKRVLERMGGHTVLVANAIDEARTMLAAIPDSPPDLIVCDGNIHTKNQHDGADFAVELQGAGYNVVTFSSYTYKDWGLRSFIKPLPPAGILEMVEVSLPDS
jgi:DNA-binding NtrC family response regulator